MDLYEIRNPEECASGMTYIVSCSLAERIRNSEFIIHGCADDFTWMADTLKPKFYFKDCGLVAAYPYLSEIGYPGSQKLKSKKLRKFLFPLLMIKSYIVQYKRFRGSFIYPD